MRPPANNSQAHLFDVEAEQGLVSCLLKEPERVLFELQSAGVTSDAFVDPSAVVVYGTAQAISRSGGIPDRYAVASKLCMAENEQVLLSIPPDALPANTGWYIERVLNAMRLRRFRAVCADAVAEINNNETTPEQLAALLQAELIRAIPGGTNTIKTLASCREEKITQWKAAKGKGVVGLPSWSNRLNRAMGGYRKGILSILGGYRGEGKSTLMRQEVLHAARLGIPVGVITPEDPADVVSANIIGNVHNFSCYQLDTGQSRDDLTAIDQQWAETELPIYMVDKPVTISDIELQLTTMKARFNIGFACVDHIQYIQSAQGRRESRNIEVAGYSARLAGLARRLDIPMLVLSQLSRDAEKSERKPRLSDLRDSGAIEQDARLALLLYWDNEKGQHILKVAKNNMGPSGDEIALLRKDGRQRFEEIEEIRGEGAHVYD